MIIKHDSVAPATQRFCKVGIAFVLLALPPTVSFAADSCKADVVFLMDNTGSMGGMISDTRTNAVSILDKIGGGDPRFAGIDVQFGVATFWGDPREHDTDSKTASWRTEEWFCGRTPSYPTRGAVAPVSDWSKDWRCDGNTPDDPSDDHLSLCRIWFGESYCTKPPDPRKMLSVMTASELNTHYANLRKFARKAYRVDQQLTSNKVAARTAMDAWEADGGGDIPEANYFALHQLATEGGPTDLYPVCGRDWSPRSYTVGDCIKDGADHYTAKRSHRSDVEWMPNVYAAGSYVVSTKDSVQTVFVARKDVPGGTGGTASSSPELIPTYWQALGDLQPRSNPTLWTIVSPPPLAELTPTDQGYFSCGTGPDFSDYQGFQPI